MNIRSLTRDDAPEFFRLRLEALREDPEAFGSSVEDHQSLSLGQIQERLGSGEGDSFVVGAFDQGRLIGTVGLHREQGQKLRHKARIWGVYVTRAARKTGAGRKMLQAVLDRASSMQGLEQVLLTVATTQTAAVTLYRSLGFETFGREPQALHVDGRFIDEEYMVLKLKRTAPEHQDLVR